MFDWDRFKKGEIKVILRTEQLAKDFYKECKKRWIDWSSCDCAIWNKGGVVYKYCTISNSLVWNGIIDDGQESVEWKGVNCMKELTFKEVIANIKDEQVWDDGFIKIEKICGSIRIGNINGEPYKELIALVINECRKFKLQRKEYTFEEAFKAYESGKEIESCEILCKYKNGKFNLGESNPIWLELRSIPLRGIRGKWYIND